MSKTTSNGRAGSAPRKMATSNRVAQLDGLMGRLNDDLQTTVAIQVREALAGLMPSLAEEIANQIRQQMHSTATSQSSTSISDSSAGRTKRLSDRVAMLETRFEVWSARQHQRLTKVSETVRRKSTETRQWLYETRDLQVRGLLAVGVGLLLTLFAWLLGPVALALLLCLTASWGAWVVCERMGWPRIAGKDNSATAGSSTSTEESSAPSKTDSSAAHSFNAHTAVSPPTPTSGAAPEALPS